LGLGYLTDIISPQEISAKMLQSNKVSLNTISHESAMGLIKSVQNLGKIVKEVYVDTVGDPAKYQELLLRIFPSVNITVSKKADSLFPIVSAASICAKVTRDHCLKDWKFIEKNIPVDMSTAGSGYPADEISKKWLEESCDPVFGWTQVVRFSWSTCTVLLDQKAKVVNWGDEDEEETGGKTQKLTNFFSKAPKPSDAKEKENGNKKKRKMREDDDSTRTLGSQLSCTLLPRPLTARAKYFKDHQLSLVHLTAL